MSASKGEQDKENKVKLTKNKNSASTSKCNTENDICAIKGISSSIGHNDKQCSLPSPKCAFKQGSADNRRNSEDLINYEPDCSNSCELDKKLPAQCVSSSSCINHSGPSSQNLYPLLSNNNAPNICVSNAAGQYSPVLEPIHMTLEEVRNSLSSPVGCSMQSEETRNSPNSSDATFMSAESNIQLETPRSNILKDCLRRTFYPKFSGSVSSNKNDRNINKRKSFPASFKFNFKSIFNIKKSQSVDSSVLQQNLSKSDDQLDWPVNKPSHSISNPTISPFNQRSLPPVPVFYPGGGIGNPEYDQEAFLASVNDGFILNGSNGAQNIRSSDFAASIEKVKDCGWYWGPVNGQVAEKLLNTEPDGSFIVRDSSDEHYIFSLTFKLNGLVRHVRIEHDQGNFSFGSLQKFKSTTIVDFIENAVEHSRSGRYLFFLHRRPILGPMRVQLLHPLSRFKHVQSLQHQCRFVILKHVRRDFIGDLPLPQRLKDYLGYPNYYSEKVDFLCEPDNNHINLAELLNFDNTEVVDVNDDLDSSDVESIPVSTENQHSTYYENSEVDSANHLDNSRSFLNVNNDLSVSLDEAHASDVSSDVSNFHLESSNVNLSQTSDSNNFTNASNLLFSNNNGIKSDSSENSVFSSAQTPQENGSHLTRNVENVDFAESIADEIWTNDSENFNNCDLSVKILQSKDVNVEELKYNFHGSSLSIHSSDDETNADAHYEQLKKNDSDLKSLDVNVGETVENKQLEYLDPQRLNIF